ncbi:MAG: hypothetical protein AUJ52_08375 [Elusimicrobia bacterium CG1_02_63_36]|nr:MAG: hypothetical protein AUJ52_08375 [Elusimicrobia bacterium CG1_02_63_36]
MPALLALAIGISAFAAVFALQNTDPVAVSFLVWRKEASLALVLLGTFGLGAALGVLACVPALLKATWKGRHAVKPAAPEKNPAKTSDAPAVPPTNPNPPAS